MSLILDFLMVIIQRELNSESLKSKSLLIYTYFLFISFFLCFVFDFKNRSHFNFPVGFFKLGNKFRKMRSWGLLNLIVEEITYLAYFIGFILFSCSFISSHEGEEFLKSFLRSLQEVIGKFYFFLGLSASSSNNEIFVRKNNYLNIPDISSKNVKIFVWTKKIKDRFFFIIFFSV